MFAFYSLTGTKLTYRVPPCQLGPDWRKFEGIGLPMNHPSLQTTAPIALLD